MLIPGPADAIVSYIVLNIRSEVRACLDWIDDTVRALDVADGEVGPKFADDFSTMRI